MATTLVRRRIVGYAKVKRKPLVPQPKKAEGSSELIGERAKPFVFLGVAPTRVKIQKPWWVRAGKPVAISCGILACIVGGIMVLSSTGKSGSRDYEYSAATSPVSRPVMASVHQGSAGGAHHGSSTESGGSAFGNRSTPTDESFRASAYVRKKVYLPNSSGTCVVTGRATQDIAACLRQQEARPEN